MRWPITCGAASTEGAGGAPLGPPRGPLDLQGPAGAARDQQDPIPHLPVTPQSPLPAAIKCPCGESLWVWNFWVLWGGSSMRGRAHEVRLCPPPRVEEPAPDTRVQGCCHAPGGQSPRWGGGDASAPAPRCSPPPPSTLRRQNWGTEALLEGCTHGGGCTGSRGESSWGSRQQLEERVGQNKGTPDILASCEAGPGVQGTVWGRGGDWGGGGVG